MNLLAILSSLPVIIDDVQKLMPAILALINAVKNVGVQATADHLTPGQPNSPGLN